MDQVMHKAAIVKRMNDRMPDIDTEVVAQAYTAFVDAIADILIEGNLAKVVGLGTFSVRYLAPRNTFDPQTGDLVETDPKYLPKMRFSHGFKQKVVANLAEAAAAREREGD